MQFCEVFGVSTVDHAFLLTVGESAPVRDRLFFLMIGLAFEGGLRLVEARLQDDEVRIALLLLPH